MRHRGQCWNPWNKSTLLVSKSLWFWATGSSLFIQGLPCCVIRRSKWGSTSKLCRGRSGASPPVFAFHSPLPELPPVSFRFSPCLNDCPAFPNPPSTGLGELHGFLHQQSSQTVAFTTGDPPGSHLVRASLWKRKANHKPIMGLRIRQDSNPCSVKLLEKGPSICHLLSWYVKSCIFK